MSLDPSIPLQVQHAPLIDPLKSIGSIMQMRDMGAQIQQRQALAEQEHQNTLALQAETEKRNRALKDQNTEQELMKDPETARAFSAGNFDALNGKAQPGYIAARREAALKQNEAIATKATKDLELWHNQHAEIAQAINGLKALGDDAAIASAAPATFTELQRSGAIPPGTAMPPISGAKDLDTYLAKNAAYQGAIDGALKTQKEKQDLAIKKTAEERAAALAPGALTKQALDITKLRQETTGTTPISLTDKAKLDAKGETERNPTEASLALKVALGKAPDATPEDKAAGAAAEIALKRLDLSKLQSRPITNINMTPEQASTTAAGIADGRISDPATIRAMLRRQPGLMADVLKLDPKFDETQIDKRSQTLKEFTSTSNTKAGGQALALNVLIHHAELYQQAGEALKNGSFKPGNAAYNAIASAFGSAPPQSANLVARFLAGETGKVATGGVPAEGEINGILQSLGSNASPEQIRGAGQKLLEIASGRAIPLIERVKDSNLDNVVHVLGPDAQRILANRGFDPATMKVQGGAAPATGSHRIKVSGKLYDYKGTGDTADLKNYTEVKP